MVDLHDQPRRLFETLWQTIHGRSDLRGAIADIGPRRTHESPRPQALPSREPEEHPAGASQYRRQVIEYARQLNLASVEAWLRDQDPVVFENDLPGQVVLNGLHKICCIVQVFGDGSDKPQAAKNLIDSERNKRYAAQYASYVLYRLLYDQVGKTWSSDEIRDTAQTLAEHLNSRLFNGTQVAQALPEMPFNMTYHDIPDQSRSGPGNVRPLMVSLVDPDGGPPTRILCESVPERSYPAERAY